MTILTAIYEITQRYVEARVTARTSIKGIGMALLTLDEVRFRRRSM
ncbi:MAG: hypothetical protein JRI85_12395 [Deltaproteobacteria bacterium]|nr:hypothetical protein [Deltaproteobacteria bacterium]